MWIPVKVPPEKCQKVYIMYGGFKVRELEALAFWTVAIV